MMATRRQKSLGMDSSLNNHDLRLFPDLVDLQELGTVSDDDYPGSLVSPGPNDERFESELLKDDDFANDFVSYLTGDVSSDDAVSVASSSTDEDVEITAPSVENTHTSKTVFSPPVKMQNQNAPVKQHMQVQQTQLPIIRQSVLSNGTQINGTTYVVVNRRQSKDSECSTESLFNKSMSKNAIAARQNRQKKKSYIDGLEHSVKYLRTENSGLKNQLAITKLSVESLRNEVKYLRSVLANQSTLSSLLKNIKSTPDVNFSIPESSDDAVDQPKIGMTTRGKKRKLETTVQNKREQKENIPNHVVSHGQNSKIQKLDHCYATVEFKNGLPVELIEEVEVLEEDPGVCLHVSGKNVSLEFCSECSHKASRERQK